MLHLISACVNSLRFNTSEAAAPKEESRRQYFKWFKNNWWLTSLILATVRKPSALVRTELQDFGRYVAECLPKYIQKVQLTAGDELEVLVVPDGIIPVLQFLKDHHNAQFASLVDIAGMDVPSRPCRFEVIFVLFITSLLHSVLLLWSLVAKACRTERHYIFF